MLSYHNDPAVKAKYVARFEAHRKADEVIQGTGFDNGRGCFVGCTLDRYDHELFPVELGWPQWLAHLADAIFEGLPASEAPQFGSDLLAAIPVGVDLEPVRSVYLIAQHKRSLRRLEGNAEPYAQQCRDAIQGVITWLEQGATESAARSAARSAAWSASESAAAAAESSAKAAKAARSAVRSAARSAAWSAESAAESAAWSAAWSASESAASAAESSAKAVESAAWSAESAARSAESASESAAWSAARSAARSAETQSQRDDLLSAIMALSSECDMHDDESN